jgi:GDP-L-fucose synthase
MKLVTGSNGFLGSAIKKSLEEKAEEAVFFTRDNFDLANGQQIPSLQGIDTIIHCADYYPGLKYTSEHSKEVYEINVNLFKNMFELARENNIRKVFTIGTTGCYPVTNELLKEDMLAMNNPEKTNPKLIGYNLSRFTLFDIAQLYKSMFEIEHKHLILPNLYGPGDRFEVEKSHLLASWIRDFTSAKDRRNELIELWGSPRAQREFMYIEDAAGFILALTDQDIHREILNVGCGLTPTYEQLAKTILQAIRYDSPGRIQWDESRKNLRMREAMDLTELNKYSKILTQTTTFNEGINKTVAYYKKIRGNLK